MDLYIFGIGRTIVRAAERVGVPANRLPIVRSTTYGDRWAADVRPLGVASPELRLGEVGCGHLEVYRGHHIITDGTARVVREGRRSGVRSETLYHPYHEGCREEPDTVVVEGATYVVALENYSRGRLWPSGSITFLASVEGGEDALVAAAKAAMAEYEYFLAPS